MNTNPPLLILAEMTTAGATTGVNRYVSMWLNASADVPLRVVYLRFENDRFRFAIRRVQEARYLRIDIPLPEAVPVLVGRRDRMRRYMDAIFPQIRDCFEDSCTLHLHTINLIDLALRARQEVRCRTILHLHCIPWKNLYNSDPPRFARLQKRWSAPHKTDARDYYVISNEQEAYEGADEIVCVTHSGRKFLERLGIPAEKITVIYNGLPDRPEAGRRDYRLHSLPRLLFVGSAHRSKGLSFVLQAVDRLRECGCPVELTVAGSVRPRLKTEWQEQHPQLRLRFLGNVDYETLCAEYRRADLGIIASLQEQCSYAAIEMTMHALPVVVTSADGLGEMFTHGEDALVADPCTAPSGELSLDPDTLVAHLVRLLHDETLRRRLGTGARQRYLRQFTMETMLRQTLQRYQPLSEPCPK